MTDTQNSPITASNAAANNIIRQWVQSVIAFSSQYNNVKIVKPYKDFKK